MAPREKQPIASTRTRPASATLATRPFGTPDVGKWRGRWSADGRGSGFSSDISSKQGLKLGK
jgi:hypothetical protein